MVAMTMPDVAVIPRPGARNGPVSSGHDNDIPEPKPNDILRASSGAHNNMADHQY